MKTNTNPAECAHHYIDDRQSGPGWASGSCHDCGAKMILRVSDSGDRWVALADYAAARLAPLVDALNRIANWGDEDEDWTITHDTFADWASEVADEALAQIGGAQ